MSSRNTEIPGKSEAEPGNDTTLSQSDNNTQRRDYMRHEATSSSRGDRASGVRRDHASGGQGDRTSQADGNPQLVAMMRDLRQQMERDLQQVAEQHDLQQWQQYKESIGWDQMIPDEQYSYVEEIRRDAITQNMLNAVEYATSGYNNDSNNGTGRNYTVFDPADFQ